MVTSKDDSLDSLRDKISDIKFAMVTTKGDAGTLVSRPLTTQEIDVEESASLWFFVSKRSGIVQEMTSDNQVGVTYSNPDTDIYVSVSGIASTVDDLQRKKALWSLANQAWFPDGPGDGDVCLLKIDIVRAHYWDVKQNKLTQLYDLAKASLTGTPPKKMGESVEVPVGHNNGA